MSDTLPACLNAGIIEQILVDIEQYGVYDV